MFNPHFPWKPRQRRPTAINSSGERYQRVPRELLPFTSYMWRELLSIFYVVYLVICSFVRGGMGMSYDLEYIPVTIQFFRFEFAFICGLS